MSKSSRYSPNVPTPNQEETAPPNRASMSTRETAQYISEFSAELSYLARETKLDLLAYLLDMARLEAVRTLQAVDRDSMKG
ncbi:hypothetical protein [Microvirga lotononidis]|uniref:Uncharacterized protein n=1 Tax=Microvirga lotononidis TaxID=864069 RepID=I4Z009_9HYPH|nr:hypothetical protein [Microvirga lotononidis]EIM29551.1 hypothetical protein MicloDRAFT_00020320 [Microvirga lotononidis]WQO27139.1 hypothetical protein U0023_21195 [Microvirga lotononidis]